jgi:hypothetical protein
MRFLTDSEILKWGEELNLDLVPLYSNTTGHPDIILRSNKYSIHKDLSKFEFIKKYKFTFSVSENRINDFYQILDKIKSNKIVTRFSFESFSNKLDFKEIILDDSCCLITRQEHEIWNKKFIRLSYEFNCHFTSLIFFVTYLREAIDFISMIWSYDENGKEINLLKYNIGEIVSTVSDRSKDFIILDYKFRKNNNDVVIDYILSEMIGDQNSIVIKYNSPIILKEDNLCFSRNNRINNILN